MVKYTERKEKDSTEPKSLPDKLQKWLETNAAAKCLGGARVNEITRYLVNGVWPPPFVDREPFLEDLENERQRCLRAQRVASKQKKSKGAE